MSSFPACSSRRSSGRPARCARESCVTSISACGRRRGRRRASPGARLAASRRSRPTCGWLDDLSVDRAVSPAPGWRGGRRAGVARLGQFIRKRLDGYSTSRNRPEADGTSGLSPYLHFGQLGPREIALAARAADAPLEDRQAFIEQLVIRRELAVNFVRYNAAYDRVESAARWARETLDRHRGDPREWVYTERQLERAETHDPLWNAAQRQMVESGWMHGYLRMYWAKKILEWSESPEAAMAAAIALERPVSARRARPERLRGHRLGDRRQARPRLGPRAAGLRDRSGTCRSRARHGSSTAAPTSPDGPIVAAALRVTSR